MTRWDLIRGVAHLIHWVDHLSGGHVDASPCPARVSFYSSSAPVPGHRREPGLRRRPGARRAGAELVEPKADTLDL